MESTTVFWYVAGVILLLIALQALARPIEICLKIVGNSIAGGLVLWLLNAVGGLVGFHLALNPASAAIVGLLGLPGLLGLGAMRLILG